MRDQQVAPLERAVWFVEHVARHRGAPHLQLASRHLGLVRTWSLDVAALLLAALVLVYWAVKWGRGLAVKWGKTLRGQLRGTKRHWD